MQTTAKRIITRALQLCRVLGDDEQPSASEAQDGLRDLQTMLDAWAIQAHMHIDTIPLPAFPDLDAQVDVPAGLTVVLEYALAQEIAPGYGKAIDAETVRRGQAYKRNYATMIGTMKVPRLKNPTYLLNRDGYYGYNVLEG